MTLFNYKAIDQYGNAAEGSIDAINEDIAIASLQRRGMIISTIRNADRAPLLERNIKFFERVSNRDIVIMSRQIATLFEAQVSALRVFRLLGAEAPNPLLKRILEEVADDLQGGNSIAKALSKHPKVFSMFYINMVKAGEESGKLDQTFIFLADYLERTYEVTSKAKNALIYPAFVVFTFVVVMILMLTMVIPRISDILIESGQTIPVYTRIVLGISSFFVNYGFFLLILLAVGGYFLVRYIRTDAGGYAFDKFKLSVPYVGELYKKLYLSRLADNMNTMLNSGIPIIKSLEVTAEVVDNRVYHKILTEASETIRGGGAVSDALEAHSEIPGIMIQMMRIGEETGELGNILQTLARFYQREVNNAVDTLVGLIEPVMIVLLGLGVGVLLASVLIPIYNISSAI
jgi:type IV pilus assembly protein PilC